MSQQTPRKTSTEVKQEFVDRIVGNLNAFVDNYNSSADSPARNSFSGVPFNAVTGEAYSSMSLIALTQSASRNGFEDNRWLTHAQLTQHNEKYDKKLYIKEGEKGTPIVKIEPYYKHTAPNGEVSFYNGAQHKNKEYPTEGNIVRLFNYHPVIVYNASQIQDFPFKTEIQPLPSVEAQVQAVEQYALDVAQKNKSDTHTLSSEAVVLHNIGVEDKLSFDLIATFKQSIGNDLEDFAKREKIDYPTAIKAEDFRTTLFAFLAQETLGRKVFFNPSDSENPNRQIPKLDFEGVPTNTLFKVICQAGNTLTNFKKLSDIKQGEINERLGEDLDNFVTHATTVLDTHLLNDKDSFISQAMASFPNPPELPRHVYLAPNTLIAENNEALSVNHIRIVTEFSSDNFDYIMANPVLTYLGRAKNDDEARHLYGVAFEIARGCQEKFTFTGLHDRYSLKTDTNPQPNPLPDPKRDFLQSELNKATKQFNIAVAEVYGTENPIEKFQKDIKTGDVTFSDSLLALYRDMQQAEASLVEYSGGQHQAKNTTTSDLPDKEVQSTPYYEVSDDILLSAKDFKELGGLLETAEKANNAYQKALTEFYSDSDYPEAFFAREIVTSSLPSRAKAVLPAFEAKLEAERNATKFAQKHGEGGCVSFHNEENITEVKESYYKGMEWRQALERKEPKPIPKLSLFDPTVKELKRLISTAENANKVYEKALTEFYSDSDYPEAFFAREIVTSSLPSRAKAVLPAFEAKLEAERNATKFAQKNGYEPVKFPNNERETEVKESYYKGMEWRQAYEKKQQQDTKLANPQPNQVSTSPNKSSRRFR